MQHELTVQ